MKKILFFSLLVYSLALSAQTYTVEVYNAVNKQYEVTRWSNGKTWVENAVRAISGENEDDWSAFYRIAKEHGEEKIKSILLENLAPYLKQTTFDENENISLIFGIDLTGRIKEVQFTYPSKLNAPITVIENIENALKSNYYWDVIRIYDKPETIYYLSWSRYFSLKELKLDVTPTGLLETELSYEKLSHTLFLTITNPYRVNLTIYYQQSGNVASGYVVAKYDDKNGAMLRVTQKSFFDPGGSSIKSIVINPQQSRTISIPLYEPGAIYKVNILYCSLTTSHTINGQVYNEDVSINGSYLW